MEFLVVVFAVVLSGVSFAGLSVGTECRRAIFANFRRLNGTWSVNRVRREIVAFGSYLGSLAIPLILAVPLSSLVISTFDGQVMPLNLVKEAFSKFSADESTWRDNLKDVQEDHSRWLAQKGLAEGEEIHQLQKGLWYTWPTIAAVGSCLVVLAFWFFIGLAGASVQEFASGVRHRRTIYAKLDCQRLETDQYNYDSEPLDATHPVPHATLSPKL